MEHGTKEKQTNRHLIFLGVAAILVCAIAVLIMMTTGLKDYRDSLRAEAVVTVLQEI